MMELYKNFECLDMVTIEEVNFDNESHCKSFIDLMNHYMTDAMGSYPPHDEVSARRLIEGMKKHPGRLCCFAILDGEPVGLVNCFTGFGTFAAKPFYNVHDIIVYSTFRGRGVGRKLLDYVIKKAEEQDFGKVTLEVREDNTNARHLYESLGFKDDKPPMNFWTRKIE
jgi:ribosomal protein S18 acetylase RimI-like enzyme